MGIKKLINDKVLGALGYKLVKNVNMQDPKVSAPDITDQTFLKIYHLAAPYTATSIHRMYALYTAVQYVVENNIPGDFVEAGVWKGGSTMVIAATLKSMGITDRHIYLYDTFEGMAPATAEDVDIKGRSGTFLLSGEDQAAYDENICYSPLDEVQANMAKTGYPEAYLHYVKGLVEDTIPGTIQEKIALLRLDTDFYSSTKHELLHMYPLLERRGILIIDDYGHWEGARKAVDEYFKQHDIKTYMARIDYTGRLLVKE